jgi:hypothetical protein
LLVMLPERCWLTLDQPLYPVIKWRDGSVIQWRDFEYKAGFVCFKSKKK